MSIRDGVLDEEAWADQEFRQKVDAEERRRRSRESDKEDEQYERQWRELKADLQVDDWLEDLKLLSAAEQLEVL